MNQVINSEQIGELIDNVSEKFGYDEELNRTLKRIVPVMIEGKSEEVSNMLFDTLNRVKIFVLENNATKEDIVKSQEEVFIKQNVTFIEPDRGEYDKSNTRGGYANEPIFDENMNIVGRQGCIAITKLADFDSLKEIYGTNINISHLIHELGHAWAAEKDEFIQDEEGNFINKIGAYTPKYKVDKDNRSVTRINNEGMYIEDALETLEEEETLCKLLNIDDVKSLMAKGYVPSGYHGLISDLMKSYVEKFGKERFDNYRYLKNQKALKEIDNAIEQTEGWTFIQTEEYEKNKRAKFSKVNELSTTDGAKRMIKSTFEEYDDVFFPDNSKFTPIQKLENVFEQVFSFGAAKYNFDIMKVENLEIYKEVVRAMINEGYVLKNQAKELPKEKNKEENNFMVELKGSVKTDEEINKEKETENKKEINQIENTEYESRQNY